MGENQRVAACQFEPAVGDVTANLDAVERALADLPESVAVAVFPELCVTGYDLDVARQQPVTVEGEVTDRLRAAAGDHDVTVVVGVPERDGDRLYNSLVAVDGDGVLGVYRKQFLWGDEAHVFAASDGPTTVETPVGTLGFALCYDLNFPEVALEYARERCDVLAVSAAWRASHTADWRLLLRARALDGAHYVVGSNHTGDQRGRDHAGRSLVADPTGTVVTEADADAGHVVASVDPEQLRAGRERNPVHESRGWS